MIHSRKMDVSVNVDGTILLEDIKVPVDHSYNASLYWNNLSDQPNTSTIVFSKYCTSLCVCMYWNNLSDQPNTSTIVFSKYCTSLCVCMFV